MDMVSAAKAARAKAAKLKLCDSLAVYLQELAPKVDEGPAQAAKAIDHGGMQVMGKGHGDSAETDPWAALGGTKKGKKGKKKKGKAKASGGLQHSMIRLNGFAEVSRRRPVSRGHADTRTRARAVGWSASRSGSERSARLRFLQLLSRRPVPAIAGSHPVLYILILRHRCVCHTLSSSTGWRRSAKDR
jgi:hypothetical protein